MRKLLGTSMGVWREEPDTGGIAAHISRVAEGMAKLLAEHVTLARLELSQDAKQVAQHTGMVALFVPFIVVGYALLCVGVALFLRTWVTPVAAFLLVGGVNLGLGTLGALWAVRRLRVRPLMDDTMSELNRSAALLKKDEAGAQARGVHGHP